MKIDCSCMTCEAYLAGIRLGQDPVSNRFDTGKGWTRAQATQLIKFLTPSMKYAGLAVGLTGSVLTNGHSQKDLDLIVYPLNLATMSKLIQRQNAVFHVLNRQGWSKMLRAEEVRDIWRKKGSDDTKHVEVWRTPSKKRVDIFLLR